MPLNKLTSMGASFADNTEHQTVHHASKEAWTLSVSAVTANVPMGNLFKCILNLTANNETTSGRPRCCLRVYGDVVFHRHQPLKEALVRRPALNGMRSTYVHMLQLLQEQLQLSRQDSVASVPLPALAPGSEEILVCPPSVARTGPAAVRMLIHICFSLCSRLATVRLEMSGTMPAACGACERHVSVEAETRVP